MSTLFINPNDLIDSFAQPTNAGSIYKGLNARQLILIQLSAALLANPAGLVLSSDERFDRALEETDKLITKMKST